MVANTNMFWFSGAITPENPNFSTIAGCLRDLPSLAASLPAQHYQPHHGHYRMRL
jgi:hypothetical protein